MFGPAKRPDAPIVHDQKAARLDTGVDVLEELPGLVRANQDAKANDGVEAPGVWSEREVVYTGVDPRVVPPNGRDHPWIDVRHPMTRADRQDALQLTRLK
jgi:hypothetical protein